jgi:hypothetical protein
MKTNNEKGRQKLFDYLETESKLFEEKEFPLQEWLARKESRLNKRSFFYSALAAVSIFIVFSLPALNGISLSNRLEKELQRVDPQAIIEFGLRTALTFMKEYL